jgi:hypothetical protein
MSSAPGSLPSSHRTLCGVSGAPSRSSVYGRFSARPLDAVVRCVAPIRPSWVHCRAERRPNTTRSARRTSPTAPAATLRMNGARTASSTSSQPTTPLPH